jgi:hypothetical protein
MTPNRPVREVPLKSAFDQVRRASGFDRLSSPRFQGTTTAKCNCRWQDYFRIADHTSKTFTSAKNVLSWCNTAEYIVTVKTGPSSRRDLGL